MHQKDAASGLHDELVKARADVLRVESSLAGTIELLRSEVAGHRAENAAAFASLEKELAGHADPSTPTSQPTSGRFDARREASKRREEHRSKVATARGLLCTHNTMTNNPYTTILTLATAEKAEELLLELQATYAAHLDFLASKKGRANIDKRAEEGDMPDPTPALKELAARHGFKWSRSDDNVFFWSEILEAEDRAEMDVLKIARLGTSVILHVEGLGLADESFGRLARKLGGEQRTNLESASVRPLDAASEEALVSAVDALVERMKASGERLFDTAHGWNGETDETSLAPQAGPWRVRLTLTTGSRVIAVRGTSALATLLLAIADATKALEFIPDGSPTDAV